MLSEQFLHSLWQHTLLSSSMILLAKYGLLISGAAGVSACVRRRCYTMLPWLAAAALCATGLSVLAGRLLFDPRPFAVLHVTPLIAHSTDNGFPSDHSTVAAFVAAALWFVDTPMAVIASLAALAIGFARVYCLVHWPVDIVAGWCIGAIPAVLAAYGWRRYGSFL